MGRDGLLAQEPEKDGWLCGEQCMVFLLMLLLPGLRIWGFVMGKGAGDCCHGDTQRWVGSRGEDVVQKAAQEHTPACSAPQGPLALLSPAVAVLTVPTASLAECRAP